MSTDVELLIQSRADPSVFGVIYSRHSYAVHAYLARRLGRGVADDLLAEVFVRAFEARGRTRPHVSGSVLPWLYGIARNVIRQQPRARPRELSGREADAFEWSSIDDRLDAASIAADLRQALESLTGSEREVLLLISWEQLTIGETAEVLGISPGAVRTRLHRARARAAAALAAVPHPYQNAGDPT